jgi:predicted GIY-YIG superfamily endonuclease
MEGKVVGYYQKDGVLILAVSKKEEEGRPEDTIRRVADHNNLNPDDFVRGEPPEELMAKDPVKDDEEGEEKEDAQKEAPAKGENATDKAGKPDPLKDPGKGTVHKPSGKEPSKAAELAATVKADAEKAEKQASAVSTESAADKPIPWSQKAKKLGAGLK